MSDVIINLHVYDRKRGDIVNFPKPVDVYFKMNEAQRELLTNDSFEIPLDDREWDVPFIESNMKLYKIHVPQRHKVVCIFDDIKPVNTLLVSVQ